MKELKPVVEALEVVIKEFRPRRLGMTGSLSEFDAANHGGTLGRDALRLSLTIGARLATEVPAQDRLHDTASRAGEWTGRADLVGESFARLLQPIFDVVESTRAWWRLRQRPAIMTASMLAMRGPV